MNRRVNFVYFKLFFSLNILLLVSCYTAPQSVFRLYPKSDKTTWLFGKEFSQQSEDGLTIAVAFDKYSYNYIILDVSISNRDSNNVIIAPEDFYYLTYDSISSKESGKTCAIDPEAQLIEIEKIYEI